MNNQTDSHVVGIHVFARIQHEWWVKVVIRTSPLDTATVMHGPFASQWEAAQFASTVTRDTPVVDRLT